MVIPSVSSYMDEIKVGDKVRFTGEAMSHGFPDGVFTVIGVFWSSHRLCFNLSDGWTAVYPEWLEKVS